MGELASVADANKAPRTPAKAHTPPNVIDGDKASAPASAPLALTSPLDRNAAAAESAVRADACSADEKEGEGLLPSAAGEACPTPPEEAAANFQAKDSPTRSDSEVVDAPAAAAAAEGEGARLPSLSSRPKAFEPS